MYPWTHAHARSILLPHQPPERLPVTLYYWAQLYQGQAYDTLAPAYTINVLAFDAFGDNAWHHVFELRERESHELLCPSLQIHFLEVPKYDTDLVDPEHPLSRWMLYLKGLSPERLENAAMTEPLIRKAISVEELFLQDEQAKRACQLREKAARDELSGQKYWFQRGQAEGEARGEAREREALALKMLKMGSDIRFVTEVTGLDEERLKAIITGLR